MSNILIKPPLKLANESKIDLRTRCLLSQLRSGYSTYLTCYHHRLNNNAVKSAQAVS